MKDFIALASGFLCFFTTNGCTLPLTSEPRPATEESKSAGDVLVVKPYLQLGYTVKTPVSGLDLVWQTIDADAEWSVQYKSAGESTWRTAESPSVRKLESVGAPARRKWSATLRELVPGKSLTYRLMRSGEEVFSAEGKAPKDAAQPYRFVAFGDCGVATIEQKNLAYQVMLAKPDFVMITGDIVYDRGRSSEYDEKFWPIYNAESADPKIGAPLMRTTLFIAAAGNHDVAARDLSKFPDGLAYFSFWNQPLNGPEIQEGSGLAPKLVGPEEGVKSFKASAGAAYPRMVNYSFDYANAHWLVLDSNPYVDLLDPGLRKWVKDDLAAAKNVWKFVSFHHPGFNSAGKHFEQQEMRLMADLFEAGGVDVVFSGHVHNYQRTFPLHFEVQKDASGKPIRNKDLVDGKWTLDKSFDGKSNTRPNGVIYLITGAGGAHLYNPEQQDDPKSWQTFTDKFISQVNSISIVTVEDRTLSIHQASTTGEELDRFVVTK